MMLPLRRNVPTHLKQQLQLTRTLFPLFKKKPEEPANNILETESTTELVTQLNNEVTITHTDTTTATPVAYVDPVSGPPTPRVADGRSVPLLMLPHSVKKAYHLHLAPLKTPRVHEKYSWVTKTITTPGLPRQYEGAVDIDNYEELVDEYHDMLFQMVACANLPRNRCKMRDVPPRIDLNFFWNLVRLTTQAGVGSGAVHLRTENSSVFEKATVETFWMRNQGWENLDVDHDMVRDYTPMPKFYRTKFQPDVVLRTSEGIGAVEDISAATPDHLGVETPLPVDIFSLNTFRQSVVNLRHKPGIDNFRQSPHKHTHTSLLQENRLKTSQQFASAAMLSAFSQCVAQAHAEGNYNGMELERPLVTQSIVTDGHRIMFLVYQLNTLCMQDDLGVWNRAWYTAPLEMYRRGRQSNPNGRMIFGDGVDNDGRLKGFNEDCFRLLMKFTRMNTV